MVLSRLYADIYYSKVRMSLDDGVSWGRFRFQLQMLGGYLCEERFKNRKYHVMEYGFLFPKVSIGYFVVQKSTRKGHFGP